MHNKSQPYFFVYFDILLLSGVRHNSEDKIFRCFHFIVILKKIWFTCQSFWMYGFTNFFLSLSVSFWGCVVEFSKTVEIPCSIFNAKSSERSLWGLVVDDSFPTLVFKCCIIEGKWKLVFFGSWCEVKWLTIGWFCSGASFTGCKLTLHKPCSWLITDIFISSWEIWSHWCVCL